jgi:hypothetical protein
MLSRKFSSLVFCVFIAGCFGSDSSDSGLNGDSLIDLSNLEGILILNSIQADGLAVSILGTLETIEITSDSLQMRVSDSPSNCTAVSTIELNNFLLNSNSEISRKCETNSGTTVKSCVIDFGVLIGDDLQTLTMNCPADFNSTDLGRLTVSNSNSTVTVRHLIEDISLISTYKKLSGLSLSRGEISDSLITNGSSFELRDSQYECIDNFGPFNFALFEDATAVLVNQYGIFFGIWWHDVYSGITTFYIPSENIYEYVAEITEFLSAYSFKIYSFASDYSRGSASCELTFDPE